ncbi:hypothetical protein BX616_008638 [Lobosporangium transversale]|nr:hypothetical protein BX616_008638 [Lobosporangium transversale]
MQTDDSNYGATSAHSRQTTQGAEPASGSTSTLFHVPTRQSYDQDNVDERTQLLGHWSGEDPELTTTANTGSKKSRRRNTWNYNTRQQPSLLPTSVQSMTSISALASRPKDLPGQTT